MPSSLRAADDRGGGHARALGVEVVALAEADEDVAAPAGVGDGELAQGRAVASPESTSACSTPSTSWEIASPSKTPTAIVSAPVSGGA